MARRLKRSTTVGENDNTSIGRDEIEQRFGVAR
jgi:hypothetical protein